MKHINTFIVEDCQFDSKVTYTDVSRAFGIMQTNSMGLNGLDGKAVYELNLKLIEYLLDGQSL